MNENIALLCANAGLLEHPAVEETVQRAEAKLDEAAEECAEQWGVSYEAASSIVRAALYLAWSRVPDALAVAP